MTSAHPAPKLLAPLAAVLLALTGCGGGGDTPQSSPSSSTAPSSMAVSPSASEGSASSPASRPSPSQSQSANASTSLEDAATIALKKVPDSTLISIETENQDTEWEVQVVTADGTEHEMNISMKDGSITKGPTKKDEDAKDHAKHRDRVKDAKLDHRAAAKAMRGAVKNAKITELNLDTDHGKTVWEGDLIDSSNTKHSVKVDAGSGKIVAKK